MAADHTLSKLHETTGDNVGALDGDADRHRPIEAAEVIERPFLHALAAVNIHGVVGNDAHAFGRLLLHDGGDHRGLVAMIDGGAGEPARSVEEISGPGDTREALLHCLEPSDRHVECSRMRA